MDNDRGSQIRWELDAVPTSGERLPCGDGVWTLPQRDGTYAEKNLDPIMSHSTHRVRSMARLAGKALT